MAVGDACELGLLGVQRYLNLVLALLELADVAAQHLDASAVARELSREHALLGLLALDLLTRLPDAAVERAREAGHRQQQVGSHDEADRYEERLAHSTVPGHG